ncbi:hypothetical protein QBC32DRAFT_153932 [Pseudoneurospora amorphoporcata]|uniref:Uncharacterized protein n=1 Tax=Pseudoneurospora amorphoporcata TaxID=241081 RepID=A0AAN6SFR4_9PEZI|nr:hypothetical protein QBC32DRAFT_153932 [Pseudoneurospora amorphoporcata]
MYWPDVAFQQLLSRPGTPFVYLDNLFTTCSQPRPTENMWLATAWWPIPLILDDSTYLRRHENMKHSPVRSESQELKNHCQACVTVARIPAQNCHVTSSGSFQETNFPSIEYERHDQPVPASRTPRGPLGRVYPWLLFQALVAPPASIGSGNGRIVKAKRRDDSQSIPVAIALPMTILSLNPCGVSAIRSGPSRSASSCVTQGPVRSTSPPHARSPP